MKRIILAALVGVLVSGPVWAAETPRKDINLKCESESSAGEPWRGNITFVKIRPKKHRAYMQDMGELETRWFIYKIIKYDDDFITVAQCRSAVCQTDDVGKRVIDRVSGRMSEAFEKKVIWSWICKSVSGF